MTSKKYLCRRHNDISKKEKNIRSIQMRWEEEWERMRKKMTSEREGEKPHFKEPHHKMWILMIMLQYKSNNRIVDNNDFAQQATVLQYHFFTE